MVLKILIVEDEGLVSQDIQAGLAQIGYESVIANSAESAIQKAAEFKPQVVLMDIALKGPLDGIAAARHIKEKFDIPVIYLTAHADERTVESAKHTEPYGYVIKPFEERELYASIQMAYFKHQIDQGLKNQNRALEAFCYSVSHDLKAPLRAIGAYSQLVLNRFGAAIPAEAYQYLNRISQNVEQMGQLMNGLLALAIHGRSALKLEFIDLNLMLEGIVKDLDLGKAQVKVDDLVPCTADRALIKQVFVNLLSNAIKFSALEDTPLIHVGCEKQGAEVTYFVKDNGIGFDMGHSDRLFGIFSRLPAAVSIDGTGVGLAVVKHIIVQHGGAISAEGVVGMGAKFSFKLVCVQEIDPV